MGRASRSYRSSPRTPRSRCCRFLRGAVIVDRVRLSGLRAQIVKDKDGRFNFQDLIEQAGEKPAAKAEKEGPGLRGEARSRSTSPA